MAQNQHKRSKVPTRCSVHLIQFWSGGKDYTKDGLCVLCTYLSEPYTTHIYIFKKTTINCRKNKKNLLALDHLKEIAVVYGSDKYAHKTHSPSFV